MRFKRGDLVYWRGDSDFGAEFKVLEVFPYTGEVLVQSTSPDEAGEYESVIMHEDEFWEEDEFCESELPEFEVEAMIDVIAKKMNSVMPSEYWCLAVLGVGTLLGIIRQLISMM